MSQRKASKRPLTVEDLWKLERIGGVSLSPDGSQAVCSVSSYSMDENKATANLWLLSTLGAAPRRLTACGDKDGHPAWSPTAERIAFTAKRDQQGSKDETAQLYVIAPDGGEAHRVSTFGPGIEAFKWFPDGRRVAFVAWVWPGLKGAKAQARRYQEWQARKESGYATSEAQYRFWDHHVPMGRVAHLHVLDVTTGRTTDLFEGTAFELPRGDPDANVFDIAPDGRSLAFAWDPAPEKRLENCKALVELELRGRRFRTIAQDKDWDFDAPRYSPDGTQIAFAAANIGKKHTMPTHAALLTRGAGWQILTGAWDHSIDTPLRWSGDAQTLYFGSEDRGRCHLYRWALESRSASIAVAGGWLHAFDVAGEVVASVADSMSHPSRVHAHRGSDAPRRIERFNDDLLERHAIGQCDEVVVQGAGGDPVQMWLVYPPGFDRKKKYPVLHNIHGGPHAASGDTFHYRWNAQVFAGRGYVVAGVNYHGSSGFGYAFLDSITHRWGELELQDVEAGTDWLLKQPWADRRQLYAAGGSYGGYMVAWMNGHVAPGRYQAYICHAGCYDWTAMFSDDAYTWHAQELGAWYWDNPERIRSQSPSSFAGAMRTPTLVIHGALDYRVPDQQGLAYYNTLKAKGVEARLLWFPDENHWILKPRNSRLWYDEFFGWLESHRRKAGKSAGPA